jgi:diguanylate cyclase (GGDEF)-like protein/PAS domain S-box-containing protein
MNTDISELDDDLELTLLVVDDNLQNLAMLNTALKRRGYEVHNAESGEQALRMVRDIPVHLILLDIMMPGIDGFEVCRILQADEKTAHIPVIFMTALSDVQAKKEGFACGAVDYITKPFHWQEVLARISTHLKVALLKHNLQRSLSRQSAVLNNVQIGIVFLNAERRILELNSHILTMFGYHRDDLIGHTTTHLYANQTDYENFATHAYPQLQAGQNYRAECLMQHRDGAQFWVELYGKAVDPADLSQGFVWSLEEVTSKRQRDELNLASHVLETLSEGVIVTDASTRVIVANKAFSRLTGYEHAELIGQTPNLLKSYQHDDDFYRHIWDSLLLNNHWSGAVRDRRKDGTIILLWLRISVLRRPDKSAAYYVAIFSPLNAQQNDFSPPNAVLQKTNTPSKTPENNAAKPIAVANTTGRAILYIADEGTLDKAAQEALQEHAYQLKLATTAHEGLGLLKQESYDLVLLDCQLSEHSGLESLQVIRQKHPTLPIIVVTDQNGSQHLAVQALKMGATDYLSKDSEYVNLLPCIVENALEHAKISSLRHEARIARQQQILYSTILNSAFVAFIIVDRKGSIMQANTTACNMTGYTAEELTQMFLQSLLHPDAYPFLRQFLDPTNYLPLSDVKFLRKGGGIIHTEVQRNFIEHNQQPYLLALVRDISQRKQAEDRLQQAAIVFEHSVEAIVVTNAAQNIVAVNQAFTDITGYLEAEVLGKTPRILKSGKHSAEFYQSMWAHIEKNGLWQGEIWNRRKNGEDFPVWQNISVVRDETHQINHYISVFNDLTERKQSEEKIRRLANYDLLTNLPNRLLFRENLEKQLAETTDGHYVSVLFTGLDRLKRINDSLGHSAGDQLLQIAANRISKLAGHDYVARLGGDEFAIFVDSQTDLQSGARLAEQLLDALRQPITLQDQDIHLSMSIGISVYPQDGKSVDTLLKHAATVMARVKQEGGNHYQFYAQALTEEAYERLSLESALRQVLDSGEGLFLLYQPQIDLTTGKMTGGEALVRWRHPDMGVISPNKFIPLAETTGLIIPLGEWVLKEACRQTKAWLDAGLPLHTIAVNISSLQMQWGNLFETVKQILEMTGLPPHMLELEITESLLMAEIESAGDTLAQFRTEGIRLALDDFGTGYSSLAYLKKLPIHKLKLDRSFIIDLDKDNNSSEIAAAIIGLGRSLKLDVICEGVEEPSQEAFLVAHGCHAAQGFLYSPPINAEKFAEMLSA